MYKDVRDYEDQLLPDEQTLEEVFLFDDTEEMFHRLIPEAAKSLTYF